MSLSLFIVFFSLFFPLSGKNNIKPISYILFVHLLLILLGNSCTEGFMDYELLQHKAEQICNNITCKGSLNNNRVWDEEWLLTSSPFTCSGNVTSVLIGGDLRLTKTKYPTLSLWKKDQNNDVYNKVSLSERNLTFDPYYFTTSGPLHFHLSEPLQFHTNYVIGIRQYRDNETTVRLYYVDSNQTMHRFKSNMKDSKQVNLSNDTSIEKRQILIYPETG